MVFKGVVENAANGRLAANAHSPAAHKNAPTDQPADKGAAASPQASQSHCPGLSPQPLEPDRAILDDGTNSAAKTRRVVSGWVALWVLSTALSHSRLQVS